MKIKANNYKANEILRFIRQNTNLTQKTLLKLLIKVKIENIPMNVEEVDITLVIYLI